MLPIKLGHNNKCFIDVECTILEYNTIEYVCTILLLNLSQCNADMLQYTFDDKRGRSCNLFVSTF